MSEMTRPDALLGEAAGIAASVIQAAIGKPGEIVMLPQGRTRTSPPGWWTVCSVSSASIRRWPPSGSWGPATACAYESLRGNGTARRVARGLARGEAPAALAEAPGR